MERLTKPATMAKVAEVERERENGQNRQKGAKDCACKAAMNNK